MRSQPPLAPHRDPEAGLVWPNAQSQSNSDEWLAANHERLRQMRPRTLVLNFVNRLDEAGAMRIVDRLRAAVREGSRWQGWRDPSAPAFLEYQVVRLVDLTDPPGVGPDDDNSTIFPRDKHGNLTHGALYTQDFARRYGFADPRHPDEFLTLGALVELGLVHEVWLLMRHTARGAAWETVEVKQMYDERGRKKPGQYARFAGNSGEHTAPWIGRSLRILFINAERGIGCALESLSHSLEHMATCGALPYYQRYFEEYAMLDLHRRYGLPFDSLYAVDDQSIRYPTPSTLVCKHQGKTYTVQDYVVDGGNVHFLPNGRAHYDLGNREPVLSVIEEWRQRRGPGGRDRARPWTPEVLARYADLAPDCMGRWLVYWRQNLPGLDNRSLDDRRRPMLNWWPFLFY